MMEILAVLESCRLISLGVISNRSRTGVWRKPLVEDSETLVTVQVFNHTYNRYLNHTMVEPLINPFQWGRGWGGLFLILS